MPGPTLGHFGSSFFLRVSSLPVTLQTILNICVFYLVCANSGTLAFASLVLPAAMVFLLASVCTWDSSAGCSHFASGTSVDWSWVLLEKMC